MNFVNSLKLQTVMRFQVSFFPNLSAAFDTDYHSFLQQ